MSIESETPTDSAETDSGWQDTQQATINVLKDYFELAEEEAAGVADQLATIHLPGGESLFKQGDPADAMYLVVRGRLQVWIDADRPIFVGEVVSGESVGEVGVITGEARSADVVAVRSSVLIKFDRADFEKLAAAHPAMVMRLMAIVAKRLHDNTVGASTKSRPAPSIICVRPLDDSPVLQQLAQDLHEELARHGEVLYLSKAQMAGDTRPGFPHQETDRITQEFEHWCSSQEQVYRFVVLQCDPGNTPWSEFAESQADLILMLAEADAPSELRSFEQAGTRLLRHIKHEVLILKHDGDEITGSNRWLESRQTEYHLHIRGDSQVDRERVGRIISGNANGLVLGGGAARGFAHLGTYRALCEAGIPIDWVGGTSIGAIMGVAISLYEDADLVEQKVREAFVEGRPFEDYTLPVISVLSGNRMNALSQRFMPGEIEDLAIPFFAVSSDINTGDVNVHETGPIWRATGASAALPGVLPPVVYHNTLAVDGAVLNNLPVDVMAEKPVGHIYAAKLSSRDQQEVEFDDVPSGWKILASKLLPGQGADIPGLATLLFKATEVANRKRTNQLAEQADVLFQPPVKNFSLLKVDHFDAVVRAGYDHAVEVLASRKADMIRSG